MTSTLANNNDDRDWNIRRQQSNSIFLLTVIFSVALTCFPLTASGQNNLSLVNANTQVSDIDFQFPETQTFNDETLLQQISLTQPGFKDKYFFWHDSPHPFDPVQLQKDVVRIRRFYNRNGFLAPKISYEQSTFNEDDNQISVIFEIVEGPPVIIQDFGFYGEDGDYAIYLFEENLQNRWRDFEGDIALELGRRYTQFAEANIESQVLAWLNNRGFAFASIDLATKVDSTHHVADVRFVLKPGPMTFVDEINVEGNESVSARVVERELPLQVGDRFSKSRLNRGREQLTSMNLFRLVLADVPDQPVDSTVGVRYRVREVDLRRVQLQTGYARNTGPTVEGSWQHHNFFGGARNLSIGFTAVTGYRAAESGNNIPPQVFGTNVTLRQPYFFSRKLSAGISPFIQFRKDSRVQQSDVFQREFGFSSNLVYEFHSYRSTSLNYTLSRTRLPVGDTLGTQDDLFNKSVLSLNSTIGKTNNFLNPRRGWIFRPLLETAGGVFGSDVEYFKSSGEIVGYLPLTRRSELIGRFFLGHLVPFGESKRGLNGDLGATDSLRFENRFDNVVFYSGGATDVRGWPDQLLGAKVAKQIFDSDGDLLRTAYEPIGGRSKIEASLSYRFPFPGLGNKWKLATFLDAGQVSSRLVDNGGEQQVVDNGEPSLDNFKYGAGGGIRYETLFGFIRVDVAMKLNPSDQDLISAEDFFDGVDKKRQIRRFRLHVSIGQTF